MGGAGVADITADLALRMTKGVRVQFKNECQTTIITLYICFRAINRD